MSKFIIDFNKLNKIGKKIFYVGYNGKNYMCNRCLHIIKTNQQIGWGYQYTQTLHYSLVPNYQELYLQYKIVYYERDISKPNPNFR